MHHVTFIAVLITIITLAALGNYFIAGAQTPTPERNAPQQLQQYTTNEALATVKSWLSEHRPYSDSGAGSCWWLLYTHPSRDSYKWQTTWQNDHWSVHLVLPDGILLAQFEVWERLTDRRIVSYNPGGC